MHRANHHQALLLAYAGAILTATLVHEPRHLALGLLLVLILAGRQITRILLRTLRVVLLFNLTVSLGYVLLALLRHISPWDTLILINLRVLTLTCLTFLFIARVNLFQALGFSRTLTWLLVLAYSQALALKQVHEDFRLALVSRTPIRPSLRDRYRASAAAAAWLLDKGLAGAHQTALALRSRGFFDA
ncbi:MAG TPA: ABC transporter permease [Thiobacillaceae bacterium]|nr:ABC transporter permease [Thiobacillaceae bacterium]HNU63263.1 ABC transporter permease [Thiobacillaceae bacterium]